MRNWKRDNHIFPKRIQMGNWVLCNDGRRSGCRHNWIMLWHCIASSYVSEAEVRMGLTSKCCWANSTSALIERFETHITTHQHMAIQRHGHACMFTQHISSLITQNECTWKTHCKVYHSCFFFHFLSLAALLSSFYGHLSRLIDSRKRRSDFPFSYFLFHFNTLYVPMMVHDDRQ